MIKPKKESQFPSNNKERLDLWKEKMKAKRDNSFVVFPLNYYVFDEAK